MHISLYLHDSADKTMDVLRCRRLEPRCCNTLHCRVYNVSALAAWIHHRLQWGHCRCPPAPNHHLHHLYYILHIIKCHFLTVLLPFSFGARKGTVLIDLIDLLYLWKPGEPLHWWCANKFTVSRYLRARWLDKMVCQMIGPDGIFLMIFGSQIFCQMIFAKYYLPDDFC